MTLENSEVLENLREQIVKVNEQYEQLATTRLKLMGAIDVLEQIEGSKEETTETGTVEVVENEGDE
jgi:prefoldin subunit 5